MNNLQKVALRLLIALVLIFGGGWLVGGILNLAALASPQLVSKMECPAGATAKQELVWQSFDQPGQKTLTFHCMDQTCNRVPPLLDAQTRVLEFSYFYPAGVIAVTVLVAGWSIFVRSPPNDEGKGQLLARLERTVSVLSRTSAEEGRSRSEAPG